MVDRPLELTGERTVPGVAHETYWFARHVAAYDFAARRARGLRVLDAGCGEGYGTRRLARTAQSVVGVDPDSDVVAHARATYPEGEFLEADLCDLPLADGSLDMVVSLQIASPQPDVSRYVAELARVLRPGGELLWAAPDRSASTPRSEGRVGPLHTRELTAGELTRALSAHFRVQTVVGVHHGRRLRAVERLRRRSIPELLLSAPPEERPRWLRALVDRVRPEDFRVRPGDLEGSLELLAIAVTPR